MLTGSAEGGIFYSNKIFVYGLNDTSFKKCVLNKKDEGHEIIIADLCWYNGDLNEEYKDLKKND